MADPLHVDAFYHEGRGPELQRIHWDKTGSVIHAVDYFNPDDEHSPRNLRRVTFVRSQVVMITPEEVSTDGVLAELAARHRPAAMFDHGRSDWFQSFSPRQLGRARHVQLMFYDQILDVICDAVECRTSDDAA